MSESSPTLRWGEVLQRLEAVGVVVKEAKGRRYLYREEGDQRYFRHLPRTPDPNLPAGPYVLADICKALNLPMSVFDDRGFER